MSLAAVGYKVKGKKQNGYFVEVVKGFDRSGVRYRL